MSLTPRFPSAPPLVVFLVVAFGLAWGVEALVLVVGGVPLASTAGSATLAAVMFAPALASLAVTRLVTGGDWRERVGLGLGSGPAVLARNSLIGLSTVVTVTAAATVLGAATGWFRLDLTGLSGARFVMARSGTAGHGLGPREFVLLALVQALLASITLSAALALGEECGWRGWLLPHLMTRGRIQAHLITGVLWGAWHAPLIIKGYEYGPETNPVLGIGLFILFCVGLGTFLGWLRLRSGSVIPSAVAHGAVNAWTVIPVLLGSSDQSVHNLTAPMVGLPVVLVWGAVAIAVLGPWRRGAPLSTHLRAATRRVGAG
ncbi:MAG: CPBP family intramembrane metalloprotease [Humibacillus sp.]|nr:CPBP family intramembrane metalloprotease [Humibacillus sp.]MDN5779687.1 CPBP family intramembrane metalloprotease [Humibacillus sp.]